jgi:hypothetical protein
LQCCSLDTENELAFEFHSNSNSKTSKVSKLCVIYEKKKEKEKKLKEKIGKYVANRDVGSDILIVS